MSQDNTASALYSYTWLHRFVWQVLTHVMTAQTMSFRYELIIKVKVQKRHMHLVT